MRWRRGSSGGGSSGGASSTDSEPLAVEDIGDAIWSSLEARGLRWIVPEDGQGAIRVAGPPGTFDPFLATELWFSPGVLRVECAVPVLVPEGRVEPVLELCVRLSSQARVAFAFGPRYTPIACMTVHLLAGPLGAAAATVESLGILWERATAAEPLFLAVAAGADPREVVEWHLADDAGSLYGRYRAAGAESRSCSMRISPPFLVHSLKVAWTTCRSPRRRRLTASSSGRAGSGNAMLLRPGPTSKCLPDTHCWRSRHLYGVHASGRRDRDHRRMPRPGCHPRRWCGRMLRLHRT